jgi:hypothetical protein
MKRKHNKTDFAGRLAMMILFALSGQLFSQSHPTYTTMSGSLNGVTGSGFTSGSTIAFASTSKPLPVNTLRERNTAAVLYFKLDFGGDYIKQAAGWNFKVEVNLTYTFSGNPSPVAKTLTISQNNPEMLKTDDVLAIFTGTTSPAFGATVTNVTVNDGGSPPSALSAGLLKNFIDNNLNLRITLARKYEVDVRWQSNSLVSPAPTIFPPTVQNRLITFSWQPVNTIASYPNYEVQVLKLENNDEALKNNINQITASGIDWSNALKVETQSHQPSLSLTMAEGTGFYLWRVRPVGNYFSGGIANSENYGEWSVWSGTTTMNLNKGVLTPTSVSLPYAFYFTDPDESLNWIYSRVFTEGDQYDPANPGQIKSSEGMTYADGLQRLRQSQKYNSSENTNIVSQTIPDYSGRPSLSTLPVPVSGGLTGYKLGFVKTTGNDLYTAEFYDTDNTMSDPEEVSTSGAYQYYSGSASANPPNTNVPSAEGYPFKRTLYASDGSGRVVEESGVGKRHALGSQSAGRGRTTRISYTTPTEDELIRIFGDEAPQAKSVVKTITIDQNNVQSVTYTSKEGKTIATALISQNTDNLSSLYASVPNLTVVNSVNENLSTRGSLIASKRIAIGTNSTVVKLSYVNETLPNSGTLCPTVDCNFKLKLYLVDIDNKRTYMSDADITNTVVSDPFSAGSGALSFPSTWRLVSSKTPSQVITPAGGSYDEVTLDAGEYIFIKELRSGNSSFYSDSLVDVENDKIKPIVDAIVGKMQAVNNAIKEADFKDFMSDLKDKIDNYNLGPGTATVVTSELLNFIGVSASDLKAGWEFPYASEFTLSAIGGESGDPENNAFSIGTGCCGTLKAVVPKPRICYACTGHPGSIYQSTASIAAMTLTNSLAHVDSLTPYGLDDFKASSTWSTLTTAQQRAAIFDLVEREFINPLKARMDEESFAYSDLWKIAPGFSFGSLNFMISNMLISRYYTGQAVENSGTWYEAAVDPGTGRYILGSPVSTVYTAYDYNYDCKKVYDAWTAAIELFNSFEQEGADLNVIQEYEKQDGEGPGSVLSEMIDTENWPELVQKAVGLATDAFQNVIDKFSGSSGGGGSGVGEDGTIPISRLESTSNIIANFMDEAGYQFAAIIDGGTLPSYIGSSDFPSDYASYSITPGGSGFYTTFAAGTNTHTNVPLLFSVNSNTAQLTTFSCSGSSYYELYYPYVLKPEWMFKYFVYNVYENNITTPPSVNFIGDGNIVVPHQVQTDLARLYNAPYSYLSSAVINGTLAPADLCSTPPQQVYSLSSSTTAFVYTHINWSTAERLSFYGAIKNSPKCPEIKGMELPGNLDFYNSNTLPTCDTKQDLILKALAQLDTRMEQCDQLFSEIRIALTSELEAACYTVVPCRISSSPGTVTELEIDLMAQAVVDSTKAMIQRIKNKISAISPTTAVTACGASSLVAGSYSTSLCSLPGCAQQDCYEVILYKDNSLNILPSRKLFVKYYADCDQKVLDMLNNGRFLPDIAPYGECDKPAKAWTHGDCTTGNSCGDDYEEKTGCPPSGYTKYSKTYTVSASN